MSLYKKIEDNLVEHVCSTSGDNRLYIVYLNPTSIKVFQNEFETKIGVKFKDPVDNNIKYRLINNIVYYINTDTSLKDGEIKVKQSVKRI